VRLEDKQSAVALQAFFFETVLTVETPPKAPETKPTLQTYSLPNRYYLQEGLFEQRCNEDGSKLQVLVRNVSEGGSNVYYYFDKDVIPDVTKAEAAVDKATKTIDKLVNDKKTAVTAQTILIILLVIAIVIVFGVGSYYGYKAFWKAPAAAPLPAPISAPK